MRTELLIRVTTVYVLVTCQIVFEMSRIFRVSPRMDDLRPQHCVEISTRLVRIRYQKSSLAFLELKVYSGNILFFYPFHAVSRKNEHKDKKFKNNEYHLSFLINYQQESIGSFVTD